MKVTANTVDALNVETVLLDGEVQDCAFLADDEKGEIGRYKKDENGKICAPIKEYVYGRVQIIMKEA